MALQAASLFGVLGLRDEMSPALDAAERRAQGFGSSIRSIGGSMVAFGGQMTAFTAPITAGFGVAIAQTQTFDRTISNVNAILGITGEEAAALRGTLLDFGGDTVAGPQAVAAAYYEIVSGVADASTHMAILEASVSTAEAGQADLNATTSAMISTMNAYGFSAEQASFVSDVFSRTVGMGVLSMNDMASAFPQVTGLAAQFNIGVDEAGGSLAYLTTQGYSASQSATYLRGMMTTLLNPTTQMQSAISDLGYESGQALLESEGLVGAYQLLSQQNGGLAGLVTNQEALMGALALTNDGASEFLTTYNEGIAGATTAAGAIQDETEGWDLFNSALQEVSITVGSSVMPVLTGLLTDTIIPLMQGVATWMQQNPMLAQTILMVVGAVTTLGPIIAGLGFVVSGIGVVFGALFSPIGLVIGAVVALGVAFVSSMGGIEPAVQAVVGWFNENLLPAFSAVALWAQENLFPVFVTLAGWLAENIPAAIGAAAGFWTGTLWPALQSVWGFISENVIPIFGVVVGWLAENIPVAIGAAAGFWTGTLWPALQAVWGFISANILPIFAAVAEFLVGTLGVAIQVLAGLWNDTLWPALQVVWGFISEQLMPIFLTVSGFLGEVLVTAIGVLMEVWNNVLMVALDTAWAFISDFLMPIFEGMADFFDGALTLSINTLSGLWDTVLGPAIQGVIDIIGGIWESAQPGIDALKNGIESAFNWIRDSVIGPFIDTISGIGDSIGNALSSAGDFVSGLNPFAEGNILGPGRAGGGELERGKWHMVGEQGPELVRTGQGGTVLNAQQAWAAERMAMQGAMAQMQQASGGDGGITIQNLTVVANDPDDFRRQLEERRRMRG